MKWSEVTVKVSEPDGDDFVWLEVCNAGRCTGYNMGSPDENQVLLRAAGLENLPPGAVVHERVATLH